MFEKLNLMVVIEAVLLSSSLLLVTLRKRLPRLWSLRLYMLVALGVSVFQSITAQLIMLSDSSTSFGAFSWPYISLFLFCLIALLVAISLKKPDIVEDLTEDINWIPFKMATGAMMFCTQIRGKEPAMLVMFMLVGYPVFLAANKNNPFQFSAWSGLTFLSLGAGVGASLYSISTLPLSSHPFGLINLVITLTLICFWWFNQKLTAPKA